MLPKGEKNSDSLGKSLCTKYIVKLTNLYVYHIHVNGYENEDSLYMKGIFSDCLLSDIFDYS